MTSDTSSIVPGRLRFLRLHLTNFLSYRSATLNFDDFTALVGPNASGKSNAVSAIKLLREIPIHGLPAALARRGGFDQLRHRSRGRPYDPAIRLDFVFEGSELSFYELKLGALAGKRYEVKEERGHVHQGGDHFFFTSKRGELEWEDYMSDANGGGSNRNDFKLRVPPGQSAVPFSGSFGAYMVSNVLQSMQTVEINPSLVGDLQEPSSTHEFEPTGANTASILESLSGSSRQDLVDELAAIVPGIDRIEVRHMADKITVVFTQESEGGRREFFAKQMSDGTLRSFSIILAMQQPERPSLLVIEEPEVAIHLGALRTLVEILRQEGEGMQVLITTHSADIVDTLDIDSLRVIWMDKGASRIAPVAAHTREPVRKGLITPGELLRSDALDAASK